MVEASTRKGVEESGLLLVNSRLGTLEAIDRFKSLPEIEYAEPNFIYQHFAVSNDTYYTNGSLWGMYGPATTPANQYGSQAGTAWAANHTGSSSIVIGIIDEGYMYTHEDISANAGMLRVSCLLLLPATTHGIMIHRYHILRAIPMRILLRSRLLPVLAR